MTNIECLVLIDIFLHDCFQKALAELISKNKTLKTVNAESNRLTGPVITEIVRSTLVNQTLLELRLSNQVNEVFFKKNISIDFVFLFQRSQILGNRVEMEVADAIAKNNTILRLNLQFDTLGPRVRVTEKLKQNVDSRKKIVSG